MPVFGVWLCLVDGASVVKSKSGIYLPLGQQNKRGKKKDKEWNGAFSLCVPAGPGDEGWHKAGHAALRSRAGTEVLQQRHPHPSKNPHGPQDPSWLW